MEYVDVIDIDDRKIKLMKDSGLYYTENDKNYSLRVDFQETFGTLEYYLMHGYEPIEINEFNANQLIDDEFEGKFINKIVLSDSRIINHYYSFIGFESDNILKLVPVKIPVDNKYTVDPTLITSNNWYYIPSSDNSEYYTLKDDQIIKS